VDLLAGETLRICTSDDGFAERYCQSESCETSTDDEGVRVVPTSGDVPIALFPPNATACLHSNECDGGQRCVDATASFSENSLVQGKCAFTFDVRSQSPNANQQGRLSELGFCSALTLQDAINWHDFSAVQDGPHQLLLVGEAPTLTRDSRPEFEQRSSTRFFQTQVLKNNEAVLGRLWSPEWILTQHNEQYQNSYDFFASGPYGIWHLKAEGIQGGHFSTSAKSGSTGSPNRDSECLFGIGYRGLCPVWYTAPSPAKGDQALYLSKPSIVLPPENRDEPLIVGSVIAQNAVGTPQLSNDGDGVLDEIFISFEARRAGNYELVIDTNQDGLINADSDSVISG
jgi:hypothetical protein